MKQAKLGNVLTTSGHLLKLLEEADELEPRSGEGFKLDKNAAMIIDSGGRLLYMSRAFAELVGVDAADFVGQRHPFPWCIEDRSEPCRRRYRFLASERARELGIESVSWDLMRISRECLRTPVNGRMPLDDCECELRGAVCLAVSEAAVLEGIEEADPCARGSQVDEIETNMRRIAGELERLGVSRGGPPASTRLRACPELDSLSPREREILRIFLEGSRVSNIARALCISQHTVRNHLQSVYRKLGVGSQAELIEKLKGPARPGAASGNGSYAVGAREYAI
jgi:DNA-binding CsgD family transcriptional regulator